MAQTTDGMKILENMIGGDHELWQMCEQATLNADVAELIYNARTEAGLSQKELAEMINTTESVISSLEDGDYEGNSLLMLSPIAKVLNREVKIDLVPGKSPAPLFKGGSRGDRRGI